MRCLAALLGCFLLAPPLAAQAAREEVLATVEEFFRTMTANDRSGAARVLDPEGQYYAVREYPDSVSVRRVTHAQYLDRLRAGGPRMLERLWKPTVLVHGPIANVWARYDIHQDGRFVHCGVDNFALVRFADRWKIVGVTFTMEPTGCPPSPLGPPGQR